MTDVFWPDFGRDNFADALAEFQRRQRRFGAS
jgi:undecaprenyl diphosphate synthase